eukprot:3053720-Prymnesium_polylepis.2
MARKGCQGCEVGQSRGVNPCGIRKTSMSARRDRSCRTEGIINHQSSVINHQSSSTGDQSSIINRVDERAARGDRTTTACWRPERRLEGVKPRCEATV